MFKKEKADSFDEVNIIHFAVDEIQQEIDIAIKEELQSDVTINDESNEAKIKPEPLNNTDKLSQDMDTFMQKIKNKMNLPEPDPLNVIENSTQHEKNDIKSGYTCDLCGKTMTTKASMRTHKWLHAHNDQTNANTIQEEVTRFIGIKAKLSKDTIGESAGLKCDMCGKMYATKASLKVHKWKHVKKPWLQYREWHVKNDKVDTTDIVLDDKEGQDDAVKEPVIETYVDSDVKLIKVLPLLPFKELCF